MIRRIKVTTKDGLVLLSGSNWRTFEILCRAASPAALRVILKSYAERLHDGITVQVGNTIYSCDWR